MCWVPANITVCLWFTHAFKDRFHSKATLLKPDEGRMLRVILYGLFGKVISIQALVRYFTQP